MTTPGAVVPGWYGKLPGLGDFASRRLPPEFIEPWDEWLQECLAASRVALGDGWLDVYLTTPIWRFVLLPGVIGERGWAGVLMPSVDRVGRQFPLTVAATVPSLPAAAQVVFDEAGWFAALEEVALGALDLTRDADDLERDLEKHALELTATADSEGEAGALRALSSVDAFGRLARAEALRGWSLHAAWRSLWWSRGRIDDHPLMLSSAALPTPVEFTWLLRSRAGSSGATPR